jgi:hypothetical protein
MPPALYPPKPIRPHARGGCPRRRRGSVGVAGAARAASSSWRKWQFLYFLPLPHQHGSLRLGLRSGVDNIGCLRF